MPAVVVVQHFLDTHRFHLRERELLPPECVRRSVPAVIAYLIIYSLCFLLPYFYPLYFDLYFCLRDYYIMFLMLHSITFCFIFQYITYFFLVSEIYFIFLKIFSIWPQSFSRPYASYKIYLAALDYCYFAAFKYGDKIAVFVYADSPAFC